MIEHANRTLIATVVFIDIVGYSRYAVSEQMQVKTRFNEIIGDALAEVAQNERVLLDTGDGAALCFLGDPEHGLFVANAVRDATRHATGTPALALRMGINLGPVKLIKDINGQPNVIGDAINAAQRIMSFADPQQILVSRSFYELVSCLKPEYGLLFHYLGIRQDKHVREHELYAIDFPGTAAVAPDQAEPVPGQAGIAAAAFPDTLLAQLESALLKYMGPIAKVLVRKVARESSSTEALCRLLAENIPVPAQQAAFLLEAGALCGIAPSNGVPSSTSAAALDAEQLAAVQQHLANYIGPLAKVLVRRAQKNCANLTELCHALAQHIENEHDRRAFLAVFGQAV